MLDGHATFERAVEIGRRYADRDLIILARHGMGRAMIYLGDVQQGIALLDEAMVAVEAGDVSPLSGLVVAAISRFAPLGMVQFHVQGVAGLAALWPIAYDMWKQTAKEHARQPRTMPVA